MKHLLLMLIALTAYASKSDNLRMGCEAIVTHVAYEKADEASRKNIPLTFGFIAGAQHAYQTAYTQRTKKSVHAGYASEERLCRNALNIYHDKGAKDEFIHLLSGVVAQDLSVSNRVEIFVP